MVTLISFHTPPFLQLKSRHTDALGRLYGEILAFFTPVYFIHPNKSVLEKLYACAEQFFDYDLGHYLVVHGLFKKNITCVAKPWKNQSNDLLVILKVAVLAGGLLFFPICFSTLEERTLLPLFPMVTVRSLCRLASSVTFFMLGCKVILRHVFLPSYHVVHHSYDHLVRGKKMVEMGVTISTKMMIDVETIWYDNKNHFKKFYLDQDNVKWISKKVFTLKDYPNYIFKWARDEGRFINILKSQAICLEKSLNEVVVPHSNYFHLRDGSVIVVQRRLSLIQEVDQIGKDQIAKAIKQGEDCLAEMKSPYIKRRHHLTLDVKQEVKRALIGHDSHFEPPQPLFSIEEQLDMARGENVEVSHSAMPSPVGEAEAAEAALQECLDHLSHALSEAEHEAIYPPLLSTITCKRAVPREKQ